jgi:hypothetical protein
MLATATSDASYNISEQVQSAGRIKRLERILLSVLSVLYLVSAAGFAIVTPYGEAPDEHAHLLYVEHLVRYGTLPAISPQYYSYESIQAPLYYLLGAGVVSTGRVLTGRSLDQPLAPPARGNPDFTPGNGVVQTLLHPASERWPLTVYALRGLSILMGFGMIIFTYLTARLLVPPPASFWVPLLAAAFAALLPQANFIRGSISNENAAALAGALLAWLLVRHLLLPYNRRRVLGIGVTYGLGVLSKLIIGPFLLPILWVLWIRREGSWSRLGRDLLVVGASAALVAGWFFAYRWIVYGEPLAQSAAHAMLWHRSPFRLEQFFWFDEPFKSMIWKSFWGSYGWQLIWLPDWLYHAALALTLLMVAGGLYLVARRTLSREQMQCCALFLMLVLLAYATVVIVTTDQIIWQGREMFPALTALCVLCGLGLGGLLLGRGAVQPAVSNHRLYVLAAGVSLALVVGLLATNIYSIFWLVLPALNT